MSNWAELHEMTEALAYKPGWRFRLVTDYTWAYDTIVETDTDAGPVTEAGGMAVGHSDAQSPPILLISALVGDSSAEVHDCPDENCQMPHVVHGVDAQHVFMTDTKDRDQDHRYWRRWLLLCCCLVELHEAMEHFEIAGFKTFYPAHGPGSPLYEIVDKTPERTST